VTAVQQGAATAPSPRGPRSWSPAVRLGALAVVVALMFAGLGYLVGHHRSPGSGPGAGGQQGQGTGTRAGCTAPDGVKQPLRGLVVVGDPPSGWADSLGGWSVNVDSTGRSRPCRPVVPAAPRA
jgi:hypothetical protein